MFLERRLYSVYYFPEPGCLDLQKLSSQSIRNKYFSWPSYFVPDMVIPKNNEQSLTIVCLGKLCSCEEVSTLYSPDRVNQGMLQFNT